MLALTRYVGDPERDTVLVGDSIRITVVRTDGYKVVLGIDAPQNVLVLRKELTNEQKTLYSPAGSGCNDGDQQR